jgi:hypothetical protein
MAIDWKVSGKSCDEVKSALLATLKTHPVPSFAEITWVNNEMCVKIDKAGKSEFKLGLQQVNGETKIVETKRDIAFMHKPFVGKVESYVGELMAKIGAQKS